jgi:hypothetical protein
MLTKASGVMEQEYQGLAMPVQMEWQEETAGLAAQVSQVMIKMEWKY